MQSIDEGNGGGIGRRMFGLFFALFLQIELVAGKLGLFSLPRRLRTQGEKGKSGG